MDLDNDFTTLVSQKEPIQDQILDRLGEWTDNYSLSGSGSALYGLFETEREGQQAREQLEREFPDVELKLVEFLGRQDIPKTEREIPCRSK
jgi:4-diphosphocytidyl-2C-methyl-D-erythritol kinase